MNADKTDISNTNRPRNQTPGTTLPEEKSKEIPLESQSAGDLFAKSKDLLESKRSEISKKSQNL